MSATDDDAGQFNIEEKRDELKRLWEDSFDLCKLYIDQVKSGDAKLTASLLKELNVFLRSSADLLTGFANEERKQAEAKMAEAMRVQHKHTQEEAPDDGDGHQDGDDPYGHLMDGLTDEDLDVPETYRD